MKNICRFILSISLFIPSLVYSAQLANDAKLEAFDDFSGGLNTTVAPHKVPKNMATDISNLYIDEKPGSLVGVNGFEIVGVTNTLTKINFMKEYVKDDGQKYMFVSDSSRVLCTQDFQTFITIKSTLTTTAKLSAAQGRGIMMFTNGVDPVFASNCSGEAEVLDGRGNSPNIPRGKFIAYYQDRFFLFNTTSNASALNFMALTSTDGFAVNYNDPRAWVATNQLNISNGDGAVGSALDVFKGQLYAHKNNKSIYTIFGTDEFTYFARKSNAHSGTVSQDSIVQLDNISYYYAKDGIYAFDGGESVRLTDLILPNIQNISSNLSLIASNIWDTKAQFDLGGVFSNTTSTVSGLITKASTNAILSIADPNLTTLVSGSGECNPISSLALHVTTLTSLNSFTPFSTAAVLSGTSDLSNNINYIVNSVTVPYYATTNEATQGYVEIRNNRTGAIHRDRSNADVIFSASNQCDSRVAVFNLSQSTSNIFTRDDLIGGVNSGIAVRIYSVITNGDQKTSVYLASATGGVGISVRPNPNGSFVSNVATNTTLNYWDTFTSLDDAGNGSIQYYVRTGTSAIFLTTASWTPISPGSVVNASSTYKYIQWAATITADNQNTYIDRVTINHNEGGGSDSIPFSMARNGRIWVAVTTETSGGNTIIYVKSRTTSPNPNGWTKINGINIKSWSKYGDDFYAGSSTSGVILKIDSGYTFNGTPIDWYYETPEVDMNDRWNEKSQIEYYVDVGQIADSSINLGISVDGSTYVNKLFSINGTGRLLRTLKLNPTNDGIDNGGRYFKYKLSNSGSFYSPVNIHGFAVVYQNTQIRDRTR